MVSSWWTEYSYPFSLPTDAWFEGCEFTSDWVRWKLGVWSFLAGRIKETHPAILEVGSWEGPSAIAWLNLVANSTIACVDVWRVADNEKRFDRNVSRFGDRVRKLKGDSPNELIKLHGQRRRFDLIYLDGDHTRESTLRDSVLAWPLLKRGGILLWDDYLWEIHRPIEERPQEAIDWFVSAHPELEIIHRGFQVAGVRAVDSIA